jgi:hypothetical protein
MRYIAGALGLIIGVAGCSKKEEAQPTTAASAAESTAAAAPEPKKAASAPAAAAPASALPGAQDVRDALVRKEYSGAVDRLIALRGLAQGDDKWAEYRQLGADVGEQLSEAAKTDPAAVPALQKYRSYMFGNR